MQPQRFDTVITGAGISVGPPSSLPSGDALAASAWRSLFNPTLWPELHELCVSSVEALGDWETGLRLEHLLEVMSQSLPLRSLVRIYAFMDRASPNQNHHGLAQAPAHEHFTLNMDTLLEHAGFAPESLTHLHGRCDQPDTIVTTVKQYVALLPTGLRDQLVAAVQGKDVLVAGYSGRDFDVFPLLVAHPPRRLRWLVHPGSELTAEVRTGLDAVSATPGCTVDRSEGTLSDVFPEIWSQLPEDGPRSGAGDWPPTVDFEDLPLSARALAAARVLFDIGELDKVARLAQLRPCTEGDAIHLRKVVARTARRQDRNARALLMLLKPPTTASQARVWIRNGNEVSSLISRLGLPVLGAGMDRAMLAAARSQSSVRSRQLEMTLQTRLGQRASVLGKVDVAAARLNDVVHSDDIAAVLGPAGEADAITWLIDALKGTGSYREAVDLLPRLEATLPYTNLSQRAYAIWQGGAVQVLRGRSTDALARLDSASTVAERAGDGQALAWIRATQSDALRGGDDEQSSKLLHDALTRPTTHNYLARQYLLTQAAEHARHLGELDEALGLAAEAGSLAVPGRWGPRRLSLNYLATQMIALLVQAERDPAREWEDRAAHLRRRYQQRGAYAAAADVAILEHRVGSPSPAVDVSELLDRCAQRGWLDQADRLRAPWDWRRPWHVIA